MVLSGWVRGGLYEAEAERYKSRNQVEALLPFLIT